MRLILLISGVIMLCVATKVFCIATRRGEHAEAVIPLSLSACVGLVMVFLAVFNINP